MYRKKAEEARITAAMDENKITNVAIGELRLSSGRARGARRRTCRCSLP